MYNISIAPDHPEYIYKSVQLTKRDKMHATIKSLDELKVESFDTNVTNWHENAERGFRVRHLESDGTLDLCSVSGRRQATRTALTGFAPDWFLTTHIKGIAGVTDAYIREDEPNVVYVTTEHRNGSDWETVESQVEQLMLQHFAPYRSLLDRWRDRRKKRVA